MVAGHPYAAYTTELLQVGAGRGGGGLRSTANIRQKGDRRLLWHNGGTGGYRSFLGIEPARKTAVVVLSNLHTRGGVDDLGVHLMSSDEPLLAAGSPRISPAETRSEISLARSELERFVGRIGNTNCELSFRGRDGRAIRFKLGLQDGLNAVEPQRGGRVVVFRRLERGLVSSVLAEVAQIVVCLPEAAVELGSLSYRVLALPMVLRAEAIYPFGQEISLRQMKRSIELENNYPALAVRKGATVDTSSPLELRPSQAMLVYDFVHGASLE